LVNFVAVRITSKTYDIYIDGAKIGTGTSGTTGNDISITFLGRRADGYNFDWYH